MSAHIEEFISDLVEFVRDPAVESCDTRLKPQGLGKNSMALKNMLKNDPTRFPEIAIPMLVDDVIFHLLNAIDNANIKLFFEASDGALVDLSREGLTEMGGSYVADWKFRYSKERVFDLLNDGKS